MTTRPEISAQQLVAQVTELRDAIQREPDPRARMTYCRQMIGFGRDAVRLADDLSDDDIQRVQDALRLIFMQSKGVHNANTWITKLAKFRMERLGIAELSIVSNTRPKIVGTETACLAVSDRPLPESWREPKDALKDINSERYFLFGVGADGGYSVAMRHLDAPEPLLEIKEYKLLMEALPSFVVTVKAGGLFMGAAEDITSGAFIPMPNDRYWGSVVSLRSGRNTRFVAGFVPTTMEAPRFSMIPDRQCW